MNVYEIVGWSERPDDTPTVEVPWLGSVSVGSNRRGNHPPSTEICSIGVTKTKSTTRVVPSPSLLVSDNVSTVSAIGVCTRVGVCVDSKGTWGSVTRTTCLTVCPTPYPRVVTCVREKSPLMSLLSVCGNDIYRVKVLYGRCRVL